MHVHERLQRQDVPPSVTVKRYVMSITLVPRRRATASMSRNDHGGLMCLRMAVGGPRWSARCSTGRRREGPVRPGSATVEAKFPAASIGASWRECPRQEHHTARRGALASQGFRAAPDMDRLSQGGGNPHRDGEQDGNGQQHHDDAMTDQRDYRPWSVLSRQRRVFRPGCEPQAGGARVVGRIQEDELQFAKHDRWCPPDKGRRRVVPVYPHVGTGAPPAGPPARRPHPPASASTHGLAYSSRLEAPAQYPPRPS